MIDWAKEIDGWKDMKPVELMVRMTENGYEMEVPPNDATTSKMFTAQTSRLTRSGLLSA